MTPTNPLPAAVRHLSELITEKLASNDFTLRPAGMDAPPDDGDEVPPPPHAAATAATPSTAPYRATRLILMKRIPDTLTLAGGSSSQLLPVEPETQYP